MEIPAHSLPRICLRGQTALNRIGTEATELFTRAAGEDGDREAAGYELLVSPYSYVTSAFEWGRKRPRGSPVPQFRNPDATRWRGWGACRDTPAQWRV